MSIGLIFWIIMLLWLVFSIWRQWPDHYLAGGSVLMFILFLLLGWRVFGAPIHG